MPQTEERRNETNHRAGLALFLLLAAMPAWAAAGDAREAIVKVFATKQDPDYDTPWNPGVMYSGTGSGCIIEGRRILTNAHVVSNQTFVEVQRNGEAKRYKASVEFVSHDADLALLRVTEPGFFDGTKPLELGSLANVRDEVTVLGFPVGGDTLSTTIGIVSRIEHVRYSHSSLSLLAVQVDAAINFGNSGGPAILDGRIAGVVMQGYAALDNVGYIVPSPVIQHFLDDVADGRYDGFPRIGIGYQTMENPDIRRSHGLVDDQTGVRVSHVVPGTPASGVLREGEVLLSIAGHEIANNGTVEFRKGERTWYAYFLQSLQIGDSLEVGVLADGNESVRTLLLDTALGDKDLVPAERYDRRPSYYVFGGLVFTPLTVNYIQTWSDWDSAPEELTVLAGKPPSVEGEEAVVLATVLAADVNRGYHDLAYGRIITVDGVKPLNLADLIHRVETGTSEFVTFGYGSSRKIVLERAKAKEATAGICRRYELPADRSPALRQRTRTGMTYPQ